MRHLPWAPDLTARPCGLQVANKCCGGRIVSVLEGGYRTQGGLVSAFSRSVAAHVAALADPHGQSWSAAAVRTEQQREAQRRREQVGWHSM